MNSKALPASLSEDISFWGMTATQFLGAFNDNLFKQLVLLLSLSAEFVGETATTGRVDEQGMATYIFAAPFLLLTGIAGYLSDRFPKRRLIVACKLLEIVVMAAGFLAFLSIGNYGLSGLYAVLFLMGGQSALFGPPKYGILPEMLHDHDLPRANGTILMTTFLAIILGTALAGILLQEFRHHLWILSAVCVAIAVVGTCTSLVIRHVPAARPELGLSPSAFVIPGDMLRLLRRDASLLLATVVSSIFWMVAALVPPSVNALGMNQLHVGEAKTSYLSAAIGAGIAIGCAGGGLISGSAVNFRLVRIGGFGVVVSLAVLAISTAEGHVLGFWGSFPVLILLGIFTGLFAVPIQVFLQSRPPDGLKGRMIAVMNQANWVGVLIAGFYYEQIATMLASWHAAPSWSFAFASATMLPVVVLYRPKNELLV
ncbi:MAG: MFS transporter [Planctomycetales bacterium]|nr:MFS transporter [Planctomycetales bacterium]